MSISASFVSPPVSAAVYQNVSGQNTELLLAFTLNPTAGQAASVLVEISPDQVVITPVAKTLFPAGSQIMAGSMLTTQFLVPTGWYYRITAVNAVLNVLEAVQQA